jgi:hypothetical protein
MQKRRLTLLTALTLSLLLHFVFVAGSEIALPDFYSPPDEVLETKKPGTVQKVSLLKPPPRPVSKPPSGMQFVQPAARKKPKAAQQKEAEKAEPLPAAEPASDAEEVLADAPKETVAEEEVITAKAATPEPPPAFPIQVNAVLEARFNGFSATLRQNWLMEGFRYAITTRGKRFGFSAELNSEGSINPEGGLSPESYQLILNSKIKSSCRYGNGEVRYGRINKEKTAPLPVTPQDMASLPFHVATTFNGQAQSIFVCTGNNVYQVRLTALAEEKIKLPAGTLRTLHLAGERFDDSLGQVVRGYEVWLALDYLNYPVKFIGHTSNGDRIEFRVKTLELEGEMVLGEHGDATEDEDTQTEIPEWVHERGKREGLNNP